MTHLKKFSLLLLLLPGLTELEAQPTIRVNGVGVDVWNVGLAGYRLMYPIGTRTGWENRYYKPGQYHLWDNRPAVLVGKDFATTPLDTEDGRVCTLTKVRADAAVSLTIAVPTDAMNAPGWTKTSTTFNSSINTYYLYTYNYTTPNTYVNIPYNDPHRPTLVFGEPGHLKFDNPPPIADLAEGVMIYGGTDPYNREDYTVDPDLIILPNGNYVAGKNTARFMSTNKGVTWTKLNQNDYRVDHATTFYANGALYVIGDERGGSNGAGAISTSTDGGKTWSAPVLLLDNFRNSPSHVEVGQDRIWIAYENLPRPHTVNFLSAPVNSNLMNPASWVSTVRQDSNSTGNETDLVMSRNGLPVALPKGGPAVRANGIKTAVTGTGDDFVLPGSKSKYTAKYDAVSDKYWALTSHSDIYPGKDRRTGITLFSSPDLKTWTNEKLVFQGTSSSFHGFNYPSMQIEDNDIVFVLRTAWENDRGQAQRWHDATMLTFHRIRNFRTSGKR